MVGVPQACDGVDDNDNNGDTQNVDHDFDQDGNMSLKTDTYEHFQTQGGMTSWTFWW